MIPRCLNHFLFLTAFAAVSQAALTFTSSIVEAEMDLGQETLHVTFPFRNDSSAPVTILRVGADCGCTAAELPANVFSPGEEGEIPVTFSARGREGPQILRITVTTDATNNPVHSLTLRTYIPTLLRLSTRTLIWRVGEPKPSLTFEGNTLPEYKITWESVEDALSHFNVLAEVEETRLTLRITPLDTSARLTQRLQIFAEKDGSRVALANLFLLIR